MRSRVFRASSFRGAAAVWLALTTAGFAAAEPAEQQPAAPVALLPPADSPPIFRNLELRFPTQGEVPTVELDTYLYYMESDALVDSGDGEWTPYDETVQEVLRADFERLWDTDFLNDLVIEIVDDPFPNGVVAKRAVFLIEERDRVRIVTFEGSDAYDRTEIDKAMDEVGIGLRLDTRVDPGIIRNTEGLIRQMWGEKGYQFADVTHELTALPGGPKAVRLAFTIDEGPKVEVNQISFVGNDSISDGELKKQMKNTRERWMLSLVTSRGAYRPLGFEQDADALVAHYRSKGYIDAQIGLPELEYGEVSANGKKRPVRLRVPVTEGERYRVGEVTFDGQGVVRLEALQDIFSDLQPRGYYEEGKVRDAMLVAREAYGIGGYYEMTGFPDTVRREDSHPEARIEGDPVVDVTLRLQEGEQYFVNSIKFRGNNTTHDAVIRRELGLVERGVFDTSALKFSVRRLNQLGYFEPLDEENAIQIEKRPGVDNEVDLTIDLTEANLNQLTFGAGASQFDGFFLQLAFQTTNFLGRGESLSVSVQNGERMKNYQLSFTEPYLFDKPITGGLNAFRRDIRFINQFTQKSLGGGGSIGFRVGDWSQMFLGYSYEATDVGEINPAFLNPDILRFNPFLADALLLGQGARTTSKVTPSFRRTTVDHPIFPTTGTSYSLSLELAGAGGNTKFYKPTAEGIWYLKHAPRLSLGLRARAEYIEAMGGTEVLPIFNLLTLGGEFSLRGFDIRSVGPADPDLFGLVIGGNKSLLFNAEYLISIANPVRLIFFYDAGQVADFGQDLTLNQFRSSTGVELRFFMPVLNVPMRLIYAWNPNVEGVLNDRFQPQESTVFKFAVGTTF
ncbi:MAG: outer membrane protein assembly factor BamA [Acidobacteria bacterium]|nr:outer membrane protein assembly factor BamA [Acidobacteriota bacterium]